MNELTSDSELLVQRFLDQELSAQERLDFIARLGRDEPLRQRVIDLERLLLHTANLERPAVPDDFAARVMAGTERPRPIWQRLMDALWAPRALEWNLATAVAGVCVVLLVAGGIYGSMLGRRFSPPGGTPAPVAVVPSPSIVLVRLVIVHPGAKTIQVAGDFNGWTPAPLAETSNGAWTVTIPLEPGRYEYMYVVDGQQWIADPFAAEQNEDGFGSRNAVLDVRPPSAPTGAPL
ncbi:MAG TPA: hypothetical protein VJM31_12455 [Vicinamibacterales bacterium]|nr:hypothetical protein [Vicinamibacterales bacterium]